MHRQQRLAVGARIRPPGTTLRDAVSRPGGPRPIVPAGPGIRVDSQVDSRASGSDRTPTDIGGRNTPGERTLRTSVCAP